MNAAGETTTDVVLETKPATASEEIDPRTLTGAIEAILLSADRPVAGVKLAIALGLVPEGMDEDGAGDTPADVATPSPVAATVETPDAGTAPADATIPADGSEPLTEAASPAPQPKPKKSRRKADAALLLRKRALDAVRAAVDLLNAAYEQTERAFRIESLAGGYRVMTLPAHAEAIARYRGSRAKTSMSPAALEALAIIAYKQPMTRAKLEAIRGVACGEILRTLLDRKLITITGRAEELGRPLLYGTSKRFLELFGLATLKDLPSVEELKSKG